ncbi:MAG: autotransporter domain-containing protein [Caulobacter sp.]|nr:autotransporter domain-containing protein [Caulobacter sp.]
MSANRISTRGLLLASAISLSVPGAALAADVTVVNGETSGQIQFGGTDQITINPGGAVTTTNGQSGLLRTSGSAGAGAVINNAGTVQSAGVSAGVGASAAHAGALTITNSGTISAPGGAGIYQLTTTGPITINNSGTIIGATHAVVFGAGDDTLNLSTGSNIVGIVEGAQGSNTVNLNGSIATATEAQIGANTRNFWTLNVNSGYWTQRTEAAANVVNIAAGATLHLDERGDLEGYISSSGAWPLTLAVNGRLIAMIDAEPASTSYYDANISLSGSGSVDFDGHRIRLDRSSTLTGPITIINGAWAVTGDVRGSFVVGAGSVLRIGGAFTAPDIDGYVDQVDGGSTTGTVGGNIANSGAVFFDRSDDYTYAGVLSGTGSATKLGDGLLVLSGVTQTGLIDVKAGALSATGGVDADLHLAVTGAASAANGSAITLGVEGAGAGVLDVSGDVTSVNGAGIRLFSNQGELTVTIAAGATVSGDINGISMSGEGSARIVNRGTILNTAAFDPDPDDDFDYAAINIAGDEPRGSTVTNSGSILSANGFALWFDRGDDTLNLETGSNIDGQVDGAGGTDTLNLAGTISAKTSQQVFANLVEFERVNVNSGYWTQKSEISVDRVSIASGATLEVENSLLLVASNAPEAVTVNAGGTLQIGNGGTTGALAGNLAVNGTVIFDRSDDYLFAGAFAGNGSLIKRGAGKLTLDGVYTFSGTTTIEAGTIKITQLDASGALVLGAGSTVDLSGSDQTVGGLAGGSGSTVNIDNATLTINQPSSTTPTVFGGNLTGDGALTVTGNGILDLAGVNTYTGPTTVNGGTLNVNGSIASPVTVNSGGTLGGSGTINGGVNIGNGGALSPGNSPGVQNIAGPLTLASGSTTIVEVDPTLAVTHDRINVTAGSATIVSGAILSIRPLGAIANYGRVNDYVILTATGGVSGSFGANVSSTMPLLTPSLTYSANSVSLRLIRNDITFASLASTSNQAAVGAAAEATGPSGVAYTSLVGQDAAGAQAGYDALSGELYGAAGSLVIDQSRHQRAMLLRQAGSEGTGAWAQVFSGEATTKARGGSAEARDQNYGFAGGGQTLLGGWTLGFSLGYGKSDIDVAARGSATAVETLRAGVYGGAGFGDWSVSLGAETASHGFEATRSIVFPTVTQAVRADYDGTTRQIFGEVAYAATLGGAAFEPFLELAQVWFKSDAFSETGGTLALNVAEEDRSVFLTTIGARVSGGGPVVRPHLSLAWRHASGDIEGTYAGAFGASAFTAKGASVAKDALLVDAGLGFDIAPAIKGMVSYGGVHSSDTEEYSARVGLSVKF